MQDKALIEITVTCSPGDSEKRDFQLTLNTNLTDPFPLISAAFIHGVEENPHLILETLNIPARDIPYQIQISFDFETKEFNIEENCDTRLTALSILSEIIRRQDEMQGGRNLMPQEITGTVN